jgi:ATP-binding protein involved in chromosome partitioning
MPKEITPDAVFEALGRVKYPGFDTDIVALGIIEKIEPSEDGGGFAITVRQPSARDEVMRDLASAMHRELTHALGVPRIELKVRRLDPELGEKTGRERLEGTRYIVAVASGKGGVGKSTVAANLAVALSRLGNRVGLLDADIYGPSIQMMFGTGSERPKAAGGNRFYPIEKHGLKLVSIGFFLTDKAPVIWRGPMVMGAVRQFLKDVEWGEQDFLVVDLPPGTGDAQLTLAQQVALDGAVIVTTPQDVAVLDAERAIRMFRQVHCPILGVVENMSYFICPDCGERDEIFGHGGADRMAEHEGISVLARIPIYPELREAGDIGTPIVLRNPEHPASRVFIELAEAVVASMPRE